MQLSNVSPDILVKLPGFFESVEQLRQRDELPELQHQGGGFNLDHYRQLYDAGCLHCVAALDDTGKLAGWGLLLTVPIPRRQLPMCTTDVMWAGTPRAGAAVLRRMLDITENYGAPLLITARTGGPLDNQLARSKHSRQTHSVYLYSRDPCPEH